MGQRKKKERIRLQRNIKALRSLDIKRRVPSMWSMWKAFPIRGQYRGLRVNLIDISGDK